MIRSLWISKTGLDAQQTIIPADHLFLDEARALPALVVVRLPSGNTHFVVLWRRHGKRWLEQLRTSSQSRHEQAGEVAYLLEPDLKDGWGGLRDVHTLRWAEAADLPVAPQVLATLESCYATLTTARVRPLLIRRATATGSPPQVSSPSDTT